MIQEVAHSLGLDGEQRAQAIPSCQRRVDRRVLRASSCARQARAVERPDCGVFRITDQGRDVLSQFPDRLAVTDLCRYPECLEFQERTGKPRPDPGQRPVPKSETPLEQIEAAVASMDAAVAAKLLQRVRQRPPEFLEKAVLSFLAAMATAGDRRRAESWGQP